VIRNQNKNCDHGHGMAQMNGGGKSFVDCVRQNNC